MDFFPTLAALLAVTAVVVGLALAAWWIIGLYWVHDRKEEMELPEVSLPGHLHEVLAGVPPALTVFFVFIGLSLIAYVLYIALTGISY